jgi:hypothetical protein
MRNEREMQVSKSERDLAYRALALLLPIFENKDFKFGHWEQRHSQLPHCVLSNEAIAFIDSLHRAGIIEPGFDWRGWIETKEAKRLRENNVGVATTTLNELSLLLTALVRQDRFVEGSLLSDFNSGLLTSTLRRLIALGAPQAF